MNWFLVAGVSLAVLPASFLVTIYLVDTIEAVKDIRVCGKDTELWDRSTAKWLLHTMLGMGVVGAALIGFGVGLS